MLYILAVEDNTDILDLYEISLRRSFPHDVILAKSGKEAVGIIKEKGPPAVIICDHKMRDGDGTFLVKWIKDNDVPSPVIICSATSASELNSKYPDIYGFVQKPKVSAPLQEMVGDILTGPKSLLNYIPISISLLLKMDQLDFNLYMKLSYSKYVKVLAEGDTFIRSDAERFYEKDITHLYVTTPDSIKCLENMERNLEMVMGPKGEVDDESLRLSLVSLEVVERLAYNLGWTPAIIESAKRSIALAIRTISSDPQILKILKQKYIPGSEYGRHVSLLSMVTCCLCQQLGWTSESSQMKLAIAALMHDLAVDDEVYMGIQHWNKCASNPKALDPDTLKYRGHPVEAVTMLRNVKNLPPDIDHIILQHHEKLDGTGFPYKMAAGRISPMSTIFIIAEDLINYVSERPLEVGIKDFIKLREETYNSGTAKKVFQILKNNVNF